MACTRLSLCIGDGMVVETRSNISSSFPSSQRGSSMMELSSKRESDMSPASSCVTDTVGLCPWICMKWFTDVDILHMCYREHLYQDIPSPSPGYSSKKQDSLVYINEILHIHAVKQNVYTIYTKGQPLISRKTN